MATLLGTLSRATNLLRHHLDARAVELGIGASEYLVMRAALLNPDVSTAAIRRSLGVLDPAFSDVVKRTVYRGYAIQMPYPGDRRTRRLALTLPGEVAFGIIASIQQELEAFAGSGSWMAETVDRIDAVGRRLATIPPAESYVDDLPIDTA